MPSARGDLTFIETQLPISRLSIESYTERKAVAGQTLTGLGKWWGRKPLILCRATIFGLLLPATDDADMDREVFLRILTMDDDGMLRRRNKSIPLKDLLEFADEDERATWFEDATDGARAKWRPGTSTVQKEALQRKVFLNLPYDQRLDYCARPEQIDGPGPESWAVINAHLGTEARSLTELAEALGQRRFGHTPRVGDAFCGGGSVPFEAARLGCDAYASDLNPVATLLTWGALNLVGGGPEVGAQVQASQKALFDAVDRQICEWGIEHREPDPTTGRRWRADAYLYCVEATCPECGWRIPLAPSWVVSQKPRRVMQLVQRSASRDYDFTVVESDTARDVGTVADSRLVCPHCPTTTPISALRGDGLGAFGPANSLLRGWEKSDVRPREGDIFGERLYCIRWVDAWTDAQGREQSVRSFCAPTIRDLERETRVISLLTERLADWQEQGYVPSRRVESGRETDRLRRERGWTHWHHLFTPRQLLGLGLLTKHATAGGRFDHVVGMLLAARVADWNSKLCVWLPTNSGGAGGGKNTFLNQAYNSLLNFSCRGWSGIGSLQMPIRQESCRPGTVLRRSASAVDSSCDLWITDPPYADAVNYAELSEMFLAWNASGYEAAFPDWSPDSFRGEALTGAGDHFNLAMVECYSNLARNMPDNGLQVVMFTHQDAAVWADLALVLWAAGLRVTAAWCIATETGPAVGAGNYVQGTVLLVLRKRVSTEEVWLDEIYADIEAEVVQQLDSMRDLDDASHPNFGDTDYQLAAYAAALRVITARPIADIDPQAELRRVRTRGEQSPLQSIIESAKHLASDHLVPRGIDRDHWQRLRGLERFYLKAVEFESHGERRVGAYQELARGFGAEGYDDLMGQLRANQARVKTPTEFAGRNLRTDQGFAGTPLRDLLFAVFIIARGDTPRDALNWLKTELGGQTYSERRRRFEETADYLAALNHVEGMEHWHADARAAGQLAAMLRNDHV